MKAICTIDVSKDSYYLGTTNTDLPENTITFNLVLPLGTNSSYLTITDITGTSTNTSILSLEDNESTYVIDSSYYMSGAGTISVTINGSESFTSTPIDFIIEGTFETTDNIFVETSGDAFVIKKIQKTSSGGGSGTTDYNDLENKPMLNTTTSASLSTSSQEEIKGTINLHKVSKTGSYNDLNNLPEIPDVSNFITNEVNNLINYYKKTETYNRTEISDLITKAINGTISSGNYFGNYDLGKFMVQWGVIAITPTPNVITSVKIYFPKTYVALPFVGANCITTVMGTTVKSANARSIELGAAYIDVLRTNETGTSVLWLAVGRKEW